VTCLLVTSVSCAKMGELTEMPFEQELTGAQEIT